MIRTRLLVFLIGFVLLAVTAPAPFELIPGAEAGQDKGQGKGQGKGNSGGGGNGKGKSKAHKQAHMGADQQHGKPAASGGAGGNNWDRDWDVGDFLAAGFTTAVLNELLGTNSTALYSGARPLPPGIAKNLERGKALPPGIARKQPGGQLAAALPRVSGHEWLEAGTDLVLVQAGTQIVREVLRGVLR